MSVIALPMTPRRRWTWPDWPSGLFEDSAGLHHFEGDHLDRAVFDQCVRAVGENAAALLDDLAAQGPLDLHRPDMAGAVAAVWSTSEFAEFALSRTRWVELFRANGFDDRPVEPLRLFRGCAPAWVAVDVDGHLVAADLSGVPDDPYGEIVDSWHTTAGMAWTNNLRRAHRFARRHRGGQVYAATVAPEHLLAQVGDVYVVDPAGLGDVMQLDIEAVAR